MTRIVTVIIQARMGSTRLPGKVMMRIDGKPMLSHLLDRVLAANLIEKVIVATSTENSDDIIQSYCESQGVKCYRGSEKDVLERYYSCALVGDVQNVMRICADSPLIDPNIIDQLIMRFRSKSGELDYLSNTINRTYPLGMNCEIFTFAALAKAHFETKSLYDREHVTPYMYGNPQLFNLYEVHCENDLSSIRLTVDTVEDFMRVAGIIRRIKGVDYSLAQILQTIDANKID